MSDTPSNGNGKNGHTELSWKVIAGVVGAGIQLLTLCALIVAFLAFAFQPLDSRDDVAVIREDLAEIRTEMEANKEKLREVETQFTYMDRADRVLWRRVFGEDLPTLTWKPMP